MAEADAALFTEGLVLLSAALIAAPVFKRIGLGTVLGYLAAGVVVGPVLRFIADGEEILHWRSICGLQEQISILRACGAHGRLLG